MYLDDVLTIDLMFVLEPQEDRKNKSYEAKTFNNTLSHVFIKLVHYVLSHLE